MGNVNAAVFANKFVKGINKMILTVKEASDYLKVSKWLIYELTRRSEIPFFRCGRAIRFRIEDLNQWMKATQG